MSGWLGIVMETCPTFPSLALGSRGRDTMPFWLAVTTLAVTLRSSHMTFPWPCPSVINTLPSGSVTATTSGDFSPGAIPGPLGRLARMDVIGVLSRCTFHPSRTCMDAHPLSASTEAAARQDTQLVLVKCGVWMLTRSE